MASGVTFTPPKRFSVLVSVSQFHPCPAVWTFWRLCWVVEPFLCVQRPEGVKVWVFAYEEEDHDGEKQGGEKRFPEGEILHGVPFRP